MFFGESLYNHHSNIWAPPRTSPSPQLGHDGFSCMPKRQQARSRFRPREKRFCRTGGGNHAGPSRQFFCLTMAKARGSCPIPRRMVRQYCNRIVDMGQSPKTSTFPPSTPKPPAFAHRRPHACRVVSLFFVLFFSSLPHDHHRRFCRSLVHLCRLRALHQ